MMYILDENENYDIIENDIEKVKQYINERA